MCFFDSSGPSLPATPDRPTITETTAPEPQSVVFGGIDGEGTSTEQSSTKRGVQGLKIDLSKGVTKVTPDTTGANRGISGQAFQN